MSIAPAMPDRGDPRRTKFPNATQPKKAEYLTMTDDTSYERDDLTFLENFSKDTSFTKRPPFDLFVRKFRSDLPDAKNFISEVTERFEEMGRMAKTVSSDSERNKMDELYGGLRTFLEKSTILSEEQEQQVEKMSDKERAKLLDRFLRKEITMKHHEVLYPIFKQTLKNFNDKEKSNFSLKKGGGYDLAQNDRKWDITFLQEDGLPLDAYHKNIYENEQKSKPLGENVLRYYLKYHANQYTDRAFVFFRKEIEESPKLTYDLEPYDHANNGKYPIRDEHDEDMPIASISELSIHSRSGYVYSSDSVKRFVRKNLTAEERIAQYDQVLQCVDITKDDIEHDGELGLVGTKGVILAKDCFEECAGVYGGKRKKFSISIDPADPLHKLLREKFPARDGRSYDTAKALQVQRGQENVNKDEYFVVIRQDDGPYLTDPVNISNDSTLQGVKQRLNAWHAEDRNRTYNLALRSLDDATLDWEVHGDGITSRMNSKFECDKFGVPYKQMESPGKTIVQRADVKMGPLFTALAEADVHVDRCEVHRADLGIIIPVPPEDRGYYRSDAQKLDIKRVKGKGRDTALVIQILSNGKRHSEKDPYIDISPEARRGNRQNDHIAQLMEGYVLQPITKSPAQVQKLWFPTDDADKKVDDALKERLRSPYTADVVEFRIQFRNNKHKPSQVNVFFVTGKKTDRALWNYDLSRDAVADRFQNGEPYSPALHGQLAASGKAVKKPLPTGIAVVRRKAEAQESMSR